MVAPFQGRKGVTMNVLAACDFDLMFTYVLAGWEGSATDGKVYADALTKGYALPVDLFDIMDAGFALTTKALTPYRSTRYHLGAASRHHKTKKNYLICVMPCYGMLLSAYLGYSKEYFQFFRMRCNTTNNFKFSSLWRYALSTTLSEFMNAAVMFMSHKPYAICVYDAKHP
ncbi:hypothetical protein AeRB84_007564 [Aphanomyces euteiches]|nr:hypothetical protein AeRB84_007564 [Aphanomyces euteiches]